MTWVRAAPGRPGLCSRLQVPRRTGSPQASPHAWPQPGARPGASSNPQRACLALQEHRPPTAPHTPLGASALACGQGNRMPLVASCALTPGHAHDARARVQCLCAHINVHAQHTYAHPCTPCTSPPENRPFCTQLRCPLPLNLSSAPEPPALAHTPCPESGSRSRCPCTRCLKPRNK